MENKNSTQGSGVRTSSTDFYDPKPEVTGISLVVLGYILLTARDRPLGTFLNSYVPQGLLFMAMLKQWLGWVTQMFATLSVIPIELWTSNVLPKVPY